MTGFSYPGQSYPGGLPVVITGGTTITGDLAVTEGTDTVTITGLINHTGTLSVTEGADTVTIAGLINHTGDMAVTEGADTFAGSDSIVTPEVSLPIGGGRGRVMAWNPLSYQNREQPKKVIKEVKKKVLDLSGLEKEISRIQRRIDLLQQASQSLGMTEWELAKRNSQLVNLNIKIQSRILEKQRLEIQIQEDEDILVVLAMVA